jgi:signal peptide peptidase SppA
MLKSKKNPIKSEILALHEDYLDYYATSLERANEIMQNISSQSEKDVYRPYKLNEDGVLELNISGALINFGNFTFSGFATSYNYIAETWAKAMNDPNVKELALMIDSPGGTVQGLYETFDFMNATKSKEVKVYVSRMAASAAYQLSLVGDQIIAQESAIVASIGAVSVYENIAKLLENEGVEVKVFKSASRKYEGNIYEALSEESQEKIQTQVNMFGNRFEEAVSAFRNIPLSTVKETKGAALFASEAIKIGLIDEIALVNPVLNSYTKTNNEKKENLEMATEQNASVDLEEAKVKAAQEVKARISAILNAEEAKGREALAKELAFETELSVDQSLKLLKAAVQEKKEPEVQKTDFNSMMAQTPNPEISQVEEPQQKNPVDYFASLMFSPEERRSGRR